MKKRRKKRNRVKRVMILLCSLFLIGYMVLQIKDYLVAMAGASDSKYTIVIDAGHGGEDPGAEGVSGKYEKEYTLALAEEVYRLLKKEAMFEPHMTRSDDTFIELEDRAAYANRLNADVLISIHGNTFEDSSVHGMETYYYADDSVLLAYTIHQRLVKSVDFNDRDVRKKDWRVLTHSQVPAVLVEVGYLTNGSEEANMFNKTWQNRTAEAIVTGLKEYFTTNESKLR
ncbi:N-acetylmuramoyl-L-alanine amidase family protein [Paenibacillus marinisediminis]